MCHFCVTSVSKVSLVSFFGHVSRTHLPVCHWLDELKPLVEPLLLFLLAGLHNSFSVSGIKTNANKWCYPWVQFKVTEYNDFQRKQSINGEFRIPLNTGLAYKKIFWIKIEINTLPLSSVFQFSWLWQFRESWFWYLPTCPESKRMTFPMLKSQGNQKWFSFSKCHGKYAVQICIDIQHAVSLRNWVHF